ncbi:MAG: hypothetical protein IAA25_01910 [Candidatus Ruminococcus intestinipullorum]|nr:hypothetical protein [Candidatus Ruminococcus intestinipullorum]
MKMKKRIMVGVYAILFVLVTMLPMATDVYAQEGEIPAIQISVGNGQKTPSYLAGEKGELKIKITNQGTQTAKNVKIAPVLDDANLWPFEIQSMNYELELGEIPASKSAEAVWKDLTVREDVESKSYKLAFSIVYDDETTQYRTEKTIFVKTTAKEQEEQKEEQQEVIQIEDQPVIEVPQQTEDWTTPQESYPDGGTGSTNENASVPRVIVTGFQTQPGEVNAGSNFQLIIHLKNTSTKTAVSNMLIDIQAPSSGTENEAPAFLPVSGSSTIYLDTIPAGETRNISIDLNSRADLVQKPYSITVNMKYEDQNAVQYDSVSSVAIPIKQPAKFEISDIVISPDSIEIGNESNITCSLYNTGKVKLYNVKVKFQGDGIQGSDLFLGNIDSGATGTIDGMVTGTDIMDESMSCKMIISYEDESGKESSIEKEFTMIVIPQQEIVDNMMPVVEVEESQGISIWPIFLIILLVGIVITVVIRRRKRKGQASLEEEELLNEVERFTEDEQQ